jgi:hypothetical protein
VILGHAFITYADIGQWMYREPATSDAFSIVAAIIVSLGSLFADGAVLPDRRCSRPGSSPRTAP